MIGWFHQIFLQSWSSTQLGLMQFAVSAEGCYRDPNLSTKGSLLYSPFSDDKSGRSVTQPTRVDMLTGTGGIAFPAKTLGAEFLAFWKTNTERFDTLQMCTDDVWINGYLAMNKRESYVVPGIEGFKILDINQADSLWRINRAHDYNDRGIQLFKKHWG